jgi:hypothetical protein
MIREESLCSVSEGRVSTEGHRRSARNHTSTQRQNMKHTPYINSGNHHHMESWINRVG